MLTGMLWILGTIAVLAFAGTYLDPSVHHPLKPGYTEYRIWRASNALNDGPLAFLQCTLRRLAPVAHLLPRSDQRRIMRLTRQLRRSAVRAQQFGIPFPETILVQIKSDRDWLEAAAARAADRGVEKIGAGLEMAGIKDVLAQIADEAEAALTMHSALEELAPAVIGEIKLAAKTHAGATTPLLKIADRIDILMHKAADLDPNTRRQARSIAWHLLEALQELRTRGGRVKASDLPDLERIERFFERAVTRAENHIERDFSASIAAITDQIQLHGHAS